MLWFVFFHFTVLSLSCFWTFSQLIHDWSSKRKKHCSNLVGRRNFGYRSPTFWSDQYIGQNSFPLHSLDQNAVSLFFLYRCLAHSEALLILIQKKKTLSTYCIPDTGNRKPNKKWSLVTVWINESRPTSSLPPPWMMPFWWWLLIGSLMLGLSLC